MFITTLYLLASWNFLWELQTSIHILLAHQRHNSLALSTQGLKWKKKKKKAFSCVGVKVWNEMPNECKNLSKKSFKKEKKRALLNILKNWRFLHRAWLDNAKIQTQQNWIKWNSSTIFFVHLETLRLFLLCNEHLPFSIFSFFAYLLCPFMLYFFISVLFQWS